MTWNNYTGGNVLPVFYILQWILYSVTMRRSGGAGCSQGGDEKRQEMRRKENEANGRFAQNSQGVPIRFRLVPANGNGV